MELSKQQKTTLGGIVVVAIFGGLIYSATEPTVLEDSSAVLPVILPIEAVALPPLTEGGTATWSALNTDGIPLLEIAYVADVELPPLMEGSHTITY